MAQHGGLALGERSEIGPAGQATFERSENMTCSSPASAPSAPTAGCMHWPAPPSRPARHADQTALRELDHASPTLHGTGGVVGTF